jgi:hypothetical protein
MSTVDKGSALAASQENSDAMAARQSKLDLLMTPDIRVKQTHKDFPLAFLAVSASSYETASQTKICIQELLEGLSASMQRKVLGHLESAVTSKTMDQLTTKRPLVKWLDELDYVPVHERLHCIAQPSVACADVTGIINKPKLGHNVHFDQEMHDGYLQDYVFVDGLYDRVLNRDRYGWFCAEERNSGPCKENRGSGVPDHVTLSIPACSTTSCVIVESRWSEKADDDLESFELVNDRNFKEPSIEKPGSQFL